MIKVELSSKDIEDIKNFYLKDMRSRKNGLFKILDTCTARDLLKGNGNYLKLYNFFYDKNWEIQNENVESLLLANKNELGKYIREFGEFSESESKALTANIFKYDAFSTRKCAYDILKIEKVMVCPYCNRQYIFTLDNNKVRPQFDHFYPKSKYPYLAVSIFNLVPSCSICNQAKSALDTYKEPILYPFEEEFGDEVRFTIKSDDIKYLHGMTDNFEMQIEMEDVSDDKIKKIEKQNEQLHLKDFYDKHKDYVKDIARNHYIYTEERIEEIMHMFPGMFLTKEDVISTIYMNDVRAENLGKRPLAKLTRDIYRELEIK